MLWKSKLNIFIFAVGLLLFTSAARAEFEIKISEPGSTGSTIADVAIRGEYAVIGVSHENENPPQPGEVLIYRLNGDTWELFQTLTSDTSASEETSLYHVKKVDLYSFENIEMDFYSYDLIVGSNKYSDEGKFSAAASIFHSDNSSPKLDSRDFLIDGNLQHQAEIEAQSYADVPLSAISKIAAFGVSGASIVHAYIFKPGSSAAPIGFWRNTADINLQAVGYPDATISLKDLDANNDYLVSGCRILEESDDDGSIQQLSGIVQVYKRTEYNWYKQCELTSGQKELTPYFGSAVKIDGNYIAVYDPSGDTAGTSSIYLFQSCDDNWCFLQKFDVGKKGVISNDNMDCSNGFLVVGSPDEAYSSVDSASTGFRTYVLSGGRWYYQGTYCKQTDSPNYGSKVSTDGTHTIIGSQNSAFIYNIDATKPVIIDAPEDQMQHKGGTQPIVMDLDAVFLDLNGNQLSYTAKGGDHISAELDGSTLTVTADEKFIGSHPVTVTASNGLSETEAVFIVTVLPEHKYIPPEEHASNAFGQSLATEGNYILAGIPGNSTNPGKALLLEKTDNNWEVRTVLSPDETQPDNYFGDSVGLTKDFAAVGAYSLGENPGSVYVYKRDGHLCSFHSKFQNPDNSLDKKFGVSLAIDGEDLAVIGTDSDETSAVYVFRVENETWQLQSVLSPDEETGNENSAASFGYALAIHNGRLIIGAPNAKKINRSVSGCVYVFKHNNSWELESIVWPDDDDSTQNFGDSADVFGDYMIVGASYTFDTGKSMYAYIYKWNGSEWREQLREQLDNPDFSGSGISRSIHVAINGHNAVMCGHKGNRLYLYEGSVFSYQRDGETWKASAKSNFCNSQGWPDVIGRSIDISGDHIAVGAFGISGNPYLHYDSNEISLCESCWYAKGSIYVSPPLVSRPLADAGADITVSEGETAVLNAGSSLPVQGDTLICRWTQTAGPQAALSDAGVQQPFFTAPSVSSDGASLTFQVEVENANGLTDTDQVTVQVTDVPPDNDGGSGSGGGGCFIFTSF